MPTLCKRKWWLNSTNKRTDKWFIYWWLLFRNWGKAIPFDWDAFSGGEEDGIYEFDTGYGWFNDFELSDCYDGSFKELGISRDDITAEFLASTERINEIHMNFIDENDDECDFGCNDEEEDFKIKLLEVALTDIDNNKEYRVSQDVLDKFNKGEE